MKLPRIDIQKLGIVDTELLRQVAIASYRDHFTYLWRDGGVAYMEESFNLRRLSEEIADPNIRYYLALRDGKPAGYVKLNIHAELPPYSREEALELERIYVLRSHQGLGIGKCFMAHTRSVAANLHKSCIWLKSMDSSDDSLAFYGNQGFEQVGTSRHEASYILPKYAGMYVLLYKMNANSTLST